MILGKFLDASFNHILGSHPYKVHVPSAYRGQPLPLLVMLHGCSQDPDDFAAGTRMNALAERQACFALYPCQPQSANPTRCWNWFLTQNQSRDLGEPAIIAGITREVMQAYHIDASRVFIAGMSAGAAMAVIMAATYPDLYAAVGAHSGLAYRSAQSMVGALHVMRNGAARVAPLEVPGIPLVVFQGEDDQTVNPRNGQQIVSQWLESRVDAGQRSDERTGKSNGREYVRTRYRNNRDVVADFWLIKKSGHAWSGGSISGSFADPAGPDATREMLRFFLGSPKRSRLLGRLMSAFKVTR